MGKRKETSKTENKGTTDEILAQEPSLKRRNKGKVRRALASEGIILSNADLKDVHPAFMSAIINATRE